MDTTELEYIAIVARSVFWIVAAISASTAFAMWLV